MKVRAVANGNVYEESDVPASLIGSVFVPIEEEGVSARPGPEPAVPPATGRDTALAVPEAPLLTTAHTAAPKRAGRTRRR